MSFTGIETWEDTFNQVCDRIFTELQPSEHLVIELVGEHSHFMRLNGGKVRQTGTVTDGALTLRLMADQRTAAATFPFTGDQQRDAHLGLDTLSHLRQELPQLPVDPYLVLPQNLGSSHAAYPGHLLLPDQAPQAILPAVQAVDFTGIYAAGPIIRANRNSAGQQHWFATETFFLDYSMITPSAKAVKATYAGSTWDQAQFEAQIQQSKAQLQILSRSVHPVAPGAYRTYFAPAALAELVGMLSWGAISEASLQQGGSALGKLREGKTLSPQLTLRENFTHGTVPRFNSLGEVAPEVLPLLVEGELVNTLVNARTAKEYNLPSNAANTSESLRAPEVEVGSLSPEAVLSQLGTGLYLSNLHYLNWSDRSGGRITGMTRYACFWVEGGEIVAPIQDLRFDDSLYAFWGENLEALTRHAEFIPNVDTYDSRSLGGTWTPGMLTQAFTFTL